MLNYNVIPVVLNGVNMTKFAPPHSYIDMKDFNFNIEGKLIWKIGRVTGGPPTPILEKNFSV